MQLCILDMLKSVAIIKVPKKKQIKKTEKKLQTRVWSLEFGVLRRIPSQVMEHQQHASKPHKYFHRHWKTVR